MGEPLPRAERAAPSVPAETQPPASEVLPPEPRETALAAQPAEVLSLPPPEAARLAFHRDLLEAHRDFPPLEKTRPVYADKPAEVARKLARGQEPTVKYYFADLTDVLNVTDPVLQKHGFYHRTDVKTTDDGGLRYTLTLTHVQGYSIEGIYELLPADLKMGAGAEAAKTSPIQQRGAMDTYARRYLMCHVLGLAAEPDTDGRDLDDDGASAPVVDQKAAEIFGGGQARNEGKAAQAEAIFTGQVKDEPSAEPDPGAEGTAAPAATTPEPAPAEAAPPADELQAAKNKLADIFRVALKDAGLEASDDNILKMLDAACRDVGVDRGDLELNAVQSLIVMQGVQPVDVSVLDLVPG